MDDVLEISGLKFSKWNIDRVIMKKCEIFQTINKYIINNKWVILTNIQTNYSLKYEYNFNNGKLHNLYDYSIKEVFTDHRYDINTHNYIFNYMYYINGTKYNYSVWLKKSKILRRKEKLKELIL